MKIRIVFLPLRQTRPNTQSHDPHRTPAEARRTITRPTLAVLFTMFCPPLPCNWELFSHIFVRKTSGHSLAIISRAFESSEKTAGYHPSLVGMKTMERPLAADRTPCPSCSAGRRIIRRSFGDTYKSECDRARRPILPQDTAHISLIIFPRRIRPSSPSYVGGFSNDVNRPWRKFTASGRRA
jgi:hypothetical protein